MGHLWAGDLKQAMSRTGTGDSNDYVELGDIATARFDKDNEWTVMAFFNISDASADERSVVSKVPLSGTTGYQFNLRVDNTSPPRIQILGQNVTTLLTLITTAQVLDTDKWFLAAATNDGTGNVGGLALYVLDMAGTFQVNGDTGTMYNSSTMTEAVKLGRAGADPMDGAIAHACYVDAVLTTDDIVAYRWNPRRYAALWQAVHGVQFYLPLGLGSPEPDLSGKGNNGTVKGTPTITDFPPSRYRLPQRTWRKAAAAGGTTRRYSLSLTGVG